MQQKFKKVINNINKDFTRKDFFENGIFQQKISRQGSNYFPS